MARVLPADSPTWCSPKGARDGRRLRATRGAPSAVTRAAERADTDAQGSLIVAVNSTVTVRFVTGSAERETRTFRPLCMYV